MPQHKSCKKRVKTSNEQRLRNRAYRSNLRASVKELRAMTDKDEALKKYQDVAILLDKSAGRGILHKRNVDRNKSRLARFVQSLS
ncbi:MAG: 30S ribosomal protein S20 [candidate division Zixibacteria bacterium]|nr:30S ribosomal protein S20 [candidate division Zixibacteria bacterium]